MEGQWFLIPSVQVRSCLLEGGNNLVGRILCCDRKNMGSNPIYHLCFMFILLFDSLRVEFPAHMGKIWVRIPFK